MAMILRRQTAEQCAQAAGRRQQAKAEQARAQEAEAACVAASRHLELAASRHLERWSGGALDLPADVSDVLCAFLSIADIGRLGAASKSCHVRAVCVFCVACGVCALCLVCLCMCMCLRLCL